MLPSKGGHLPEMKSNFRKKTTEKQIGLWKVKHFLSFLCTIFGLVFQEAHFGKGSYSRY